MNITADIPGLDAWGQTSSGLYIPPPRRHQPQRHLRGVDLFAGCGGFSLGMEAAGLDMVAALEWWGAAAITYLSNLGHRNGCAVGYVDEADQERFARDLAQTGKRTGNPELWSSGRWVGMHRSPKSDMGCRALLLGDASKATGEDILNLLRTQHLDDTIDVVCGGPPCQGMSTANTKAKATDPRNNMILEFLRLTHELGADIFVMENVPPLLASKKFRDLRNAYFERAGELGYDLACNIINAANYGVPQTRRRAIIVGTRKGASMFRMPMPTHWSMRVVGGELVSDMLVGEDPEEDEPAAGDEQGQQTQMEMF